MTNTAQYHPHPMVYTTAMDDGEVILLHGNTRQYYTLNETAAVIWQGLSDGLSPSEIAAQLTETYEVEADEAFAYVQSMVRSLHEAELVETVG